MWPSGPAIMAARREVIISSAVITIVIVVAGIAGPPRSPRFLCLLGSERSGGVGY